MKKLFSSLLLLTLFINPVHAHPGRLDAQGGHIDRATGEYHFHPERARPEPQPRPAVQEQAVER